MTVTTKFTDWKDWVELPGMKKPVVNLSS
ncbi:uncharacterized protein METZ01_LOCUS139690 [marine metagenome]|uniref:Uncharacterized protein n=1 Tax=marine metagenome TaxID=408172 RepID=A0A381ZC30_9ZZZZ